MTLSTAWSHLSCSAAAMVPLVGYMLIVLGCLIGSSAQRKERRNRKWI